MIAHVLSVIAFMFVSFAAQGLSHFVVNKAHFASIGFLRPDPIMIMGFTVMIIQGGILSISLQSWKGDATQVKDGLVSTFWSKPLVLRRAGFSLNGLE